jgi:Ser/Thr protein kinase RdoA (MazF antagonist)
MNHKKIIEFVDVNYGIKINSIKPLEDGVTKSLVLTSESAKYILKFALKSFEHTIKESLNVLRYLELKSFSSPKVILTHSGETNTLLENETIAFLYHFTEGGHIEDDVDYIKLGSLVGELHEHMKDYPTSLSIHSKDYFVDRYIRILEQKEYSQKKISDYIDLGDLLWDNIKELPNGYCHGDLHLGNIIKTLDGNYSILDFDTSCLAFPAYDIMVICNATDYFVYIESDFETTVSNINRFLIGYEQYRKLSKNEKDSLYYLIGIYHYQLQATIIEIYGIDCVDYEFIDKQYNWLMAWKLSCDQYLGIES